MKEIEKKITHPAWPEASVDPILGYLQRKYIPDLLNIDIAGLMNDESVGRVALVSSFGTESAALLHFAANIIPDVPVLFLDTKKHFRETLDYRDQLRELFSLNLIVVTPREDDLRREDPDGGLNKQDPNSCCLLRKTFPLQDALSSYDSWISGRKRFQATSRSTIPIIERDGSKIKINPFALWTKERLDCYFKEHDLPRHPLEAKGYVSVGCSPCTSPVSEGADPRSGRWSGFPEKTECGIHLGPDGTLTRSGSRSAR
ncbi:MAG: phosphoadenylyl-sulfate reductase [Pseudomonadota bacterium]